MNEIADVRSFSPATMQPVDEANERKVRSLYLKIYIIGKIYSHAERYWTGRPLLRFCEPRYIPDLLDGRRLERIGGPHMSSAAGQLGRPFKTSLTWISWSAESSADSPWAQHVWIFLSVPFMGRGGAGGKKNAENLNCKIGRSLYIFCWGLKNPNEFHASTRL